MRGDGAPVDLNLDVRRGLDPLEPLEPIDIELKSGIEIEDLASVQSAPRSGLLSYEGRQVVLYIQDQGSRIIEVIEQGSRGTKVHVAECQALKEMRHKGRFERYVATNDVSGKFYVVGRDGAGARVDGRAELKVCQFCLSKLSYRGFKKFRYEAPFHAFKWIEFFEEYSTHFARSPTRTAGEFDGVYAASWAAVSGRYRRKRNFTCEDCRVDLSDEPSLIHVHRVNGVKTDNRPENLMALCVDCHRKQPGHEHMRVSSEDIEPVRELRRRQGLS